MIYKQTPHRLPCPLLKLLVSSVQRVEILIMRTCVLEPVYAVDIIQCTLATNILYQSISIFPPQKRGHITHAIDCISRLFLQSPWRRWGTQHNEYFEYSVRGIVRYISISEGLTGYVL